MGYSFYSLENLGAHKILNFNGLFLEIIAVILLSYTILLKQEIQQHVAHKVCMFFIIFSLFFPVSLLAGCLLGAAISFIQHQSVDFINKQSFVAIKDFAIVYALVTVVPVKELFGSPVYEPVRGITYPPEKRLKILGTTFLIIGFVLQLFGALLDIYTDG